MLRSRKSVTCAKQLLHTILQQYVVTQAYLFECIIVSRKKVLTKNVENAESRENASIFDSSSGKHC